MEPRIMYAKTSDGVNIAYCVAGTGPPLLFPSSPPFSHVQLAWDGLFADLYEKLAMNQRLVWFDWPGTGLSDRDAYDFSMPALLRDIEVVAARAGLVRFALAAVARGTQIAAAFAATHPDRVSHLVLADGWARFDDFRRSAVYQVQPVLSGQDWVLYTESLARFLFGFENDQFARLFAEYHRACVEPEAHRAAFDALQTYEISGLLPSVSCPTLVVQNRSCRWVSVAGGQRLAAAIPRARFIVVDDLTYTRLPPLISEFVSESAPAGLTPREAAVLQLLAGGGTSREIGTELSLSVRTVERHITNIYHKIGAHSRAQATAYAIEHGLTRPR